MATAAAIAQLIGDSNAIIANVRARWGFRDQAGAFISAPVGTNDENFDAVLEWQRAGNTLRDDVTAALALAATGTSVAAVQRLGTALAAAAQATATLAAVTGVPDGTATTPRPLTATALGMRDSAYDALATGLTNIADDAINALSGMVTSPVPAVVAAPAILAPSFVGQVPKFDGSDTAKYRPWANTLRALFACQWEAFPTANSVRLRFLSSLEGDVAAQAITGAPPAVLAPAGTGTNSDAHKRAQLETLIGWVRDNYGPYDEAQEVRMELHKLRCGVDEPFGPFFTKFTTLRALAGLANDPVTTLNDLRAKCSPAIREWPLCASEQNYAAFVETARRDDVHARRQYRLLHPAARKTATAAPATAAPATAAPAVAAPARRRPAQGVPAAVPLTDADVFDGVDGISGTASDLYKAGSCLGCGSPNHMWRACPIKADATARARADAAFRAMDERRLAIGLLPLRAATPAPSRRSRSTTAAAVAPAQPASIIEVEDLD